MANGWTGKRRGNKGWLAALIAVMFALGTVRASAATDPRELKAREDFAAGRYQQALDLFAKLYAEKLHPNYLRNIGRCYQNLGDPGTCDHQLSRLPAQREGDQPGRTQRGGGLHLRNAGVEA